MNSNIVLKQLVQIKNMEVYKTPVLQDYSA